MILRIFRYLVTGCVLLTLNSCFSLGYYFRSENLSNSPQFSVYLKKEIELREKAWLEPEGICVSGDFIQPIDKAYELTASPHNFSHPIKKGTKFRIEKVIRYFEGGLIDKEHIEFTLSSSKLKVFEKEVIIRYYWHYNNPEFISLFSISDLLSTEK